MKRSMINKLVVFISLIILLALNLNCFQNQSSKANQPQVRIGIGYDISCSTGENGCPNLNSSHIQALLSIIKARGGSLAFGLIDEKSNESLNRISLSAVSGGLDKRARINTQNNQAINSFLNTVKSQITQPRKSKSTDINGALWQFGIYFQEPIYQPTEKIFIIISDGIHTARRNRYLRFNLPKDLKIYTIGMDLKRAKNMLGDGVLNFENIDAGITAINKSQIN